MEKQNSDLITLTVFAFVTSVVIGRDASLVLFARVLLAWVDLLVWFWIGRGCDDNNDDNEVCR